MSCAAGSTLSERHVAPPVLRIARFLASMTLLLYFVTVLSTELRLTQGTSSRRGQATCHQPGTRAAVPATKARRGCRSNKEQQASLDSI